MIDDGKLLQPVEMPDLNTDEIAVVRVSPKGKIIEVVRKIMLDEEGEFGCVPEFDLPGYAIGICPEAARILRGKSETTQ